MISPDYNNVKMVKQPKSIKVKLFRHQLASIYKMETLEREKRIEYYCGLSEGVKETRLGVNADRTGYGKTLSMIGLIARDKMEWNMDVPFVEEIVMTESAGLVKNRVINRYAKLPTTLILVSPSILTQWENELKLSELTFTTITNKRDADKVDVEDYDVVLVSLTAYNLLVSCYAKFAWKRMIFDEPGHVRVRAMKGLKVGFLWLVTATPSAIGSYHMKCRGSFMKKIIGDEDWTQTFGEKFKGMILRNDPEFVKASFNMPETIHIEHECSHPVFKAVENLVDRRISDMIAADDINGAITALGGSKTENIIELVRNKKLQQKEDIKQSLLDKKITKKLKDNFKKQLIHVNHQLSQLDDRFTEMLESNCNICMESMTSPILEPQCQNLFCGKCLLTWLKNSNTCPLCRGTIDMADLVYITDPNEQSTKPAKPTIQTLSPLNKTVELINSKPDGKFIVFSSCDATFTPICRILKENDISFVQFNSSSHRIMYRHIESFRNGDKQVMFLNSTHHSAGINLPEATDIILYHKMNRSTQNQIIGRANRIGRVGSLYVHHLGRK